MITVTAWQPLAASLIKQFEGCELAAYLCPAGIPTIGWGSTGPDVRMGVRWTQEQADERLLDDIGDFGDGVVRVLKGVPTTAHQMAGLVSFAYNVGLANLAQSSVLRHHIAGNHTSAQKSFCAWNKARVNGVLKPLAGLTRRRATEAVLYGTPDT